MSKRQPTKIKLHKNFCYYPFTQMLLQPNGQISPCCWNQSEIMGNIQDSNLLQIWNSEQAQKLRKEFLSGKIKSCKTQIKHIKCHITSRTHALHCTTEHLQAIQKRAPIKLDLRLNGQCNLECIMCDVWKQPNGLYNEENFWTTGSKEIFPFLKEVDMLGGEPFIQRDTFRLLDLVSKVNTSCTWSFVTNGQYLFNDSIKNRLDKIQIRWILISLDSIQPNTYSAIRKKGTLEKSLLTLQNLMNYSQQRKKENRGFQLGITMCVQKKNWLEVEEFLAFAHKNDLNVILQFAYDPQEVSLLELPESQLVIIQKNFLALTKKFNPALLQPILLPIQDQIQKLKKEKKRCATKK